MNKSIFSKEVKNIIVSDKDYHPILFTFRNNHPDIDFKFMSKEECRDILTFNFIKDPLPYLINNKHLEYQKAKKYLNLLKSPEIENNETLFSLYQELINKGFIDKDVDKVSIYLLKHANVLLFEDNEDEELKTLFKKNNIDIHELCFSDLDIKKNDLLNVDEFRVFNFSNKFDQYFYLFSHLREEILKEKSLIDKITILVNDDQDMFYINYFSSLFKIPACTNIEIPLSAKREVQHKVREIHQNKSISFSKEEEEVPNLKLLKEAITYYGIDKLIKTDFEFAYLNLVELIQNKVLLEPNDNKGVWVTSYFNFKSNARFYITNFEFDAFYKEYKDNNVLSDADILKIKGNPSYVKTKLDRRKKLNFISYLNLGLVSRVEQHQDDKIYDSHFIEELNLENLDSEINEKNKHHVQRIETDNSGTYTELARQVYAANECDKVFYYEPLKDESYMINCYCSMYKGLDEEGSKNLDAILANCHYSVSQMKKYVSCPFKYLLDIVIPANDDEKHQLWKGVLIHKIFEKIYDKDFDYEKEFKEGKKLYIHEMEKAKYQAGEKEEIFIELIHYWLYPIAMQVRKELSNMKMIHRSINESEVKINYEICNQNFTGSIDRLIITEDENNNKYYTVVDFKTGSHSSDKFDPRAVCTGYDIQLPLYYYACMKNKEKLGIDGFTFGGVGIKHIYGSSLKDAFENKEGMVNEDSLMVNERVEGTFLSDLDYFASFNKDNVSLNSKNELALARNTKYISRNCLFGIDIDQNNHPFQVSFGNLKVDYTLEDMIKDAIEAVDLNIELIKRGFFTISPISTNILSFDPNKLICTYCPYRDVCYRSLSDAMDYRNAVIIPHFLEKKKEQMEKEEVRESDA